MKRAALGALLVLTAGSARAAESAPATYALSWVRAEGAEECPNGRALMNEVERRLGRTVFDVAAERAFEVEVTRFGNTYRSDVFVRDAQGQALGRRTLQSDEPGCAALLSATALAIALVIDPEAAAREAPPAKSAGVFEPAPVAPVAAVAAAPAEPPPAARVEAPPPAQPLRALAPPYDVKMSLRSELGFGLLPAISPGFELTFAARPSGSRFVVELGAAYGLPQAAQRGIGSLELGLTRASARLMYRPGRTERLELTFGFGPSIGALHLAVREPAPITDPGDFWFVALEGASSLQVHVTRGLFLEVGGSAFVPLRRQQFLVRGQTEPVWEEPVLAGRGFIGVGASFL